MKKLNLTLMTALALITTVTHADPSQEIYGKTYGEWSEMWLRWAYAGPKGANSIEDETGDFCAINQPRGKVWFLAGSFNKKTGVARKCSIPSGRALFYPLIETGWIDCPPPSEDSKQSEDYIRQVSASLIDGASMLTSTLDKVPISSLPFQIQTVRVQSPIFTSTLPEHNLFNGSCGPDTDSTMPAGKTGRNVVDGYWVMLPPLSPGVHVLTLHGANPGLLPEPFENGVTYTLTVKR
ncbi:MAG: hypothetical protein ABL903_06930 [Methylococcales bacterium]